jgi:hypothetical protein
MFPDDDDDDDDDDEILVEHHPDIGALCQEVFHLLYAWRMVSKR